MPSPTEVAPETTPDELYDAALVARRRQLEDRSATRVADFTAAAEAARELPADDVVQRVMMADHRAHQWTHAKLDRLIGMGTDAGEFMKRCTIQPDGGPDRQWRDWLTVFVVSVVGGLTGGLIVFVAGAILRLLGS